MTAREVQRIEACLLDAIGRGEAVGANGLLFLLRRYRVTPHDSLGETIGASLAGAITAYHHDRAIVDRAAWLALFVEAASVADDQRIQDAIADLVAALRSGWRAPSIEEAAAAIGGCLHAASLDGFPSLAADAIDDLERLVSDAYQPGGDFGAPADQVRAAFTLLLAYALSARLPYAMLAEELIQRARAGTDDFVVACEAARVLARLAALHDDPDYRAAAVIVPSADYRRDAARLLTSQLAEARRRGAAGAIYGVALLELESDANRQSEI